MSILGPFGAILLSFVPFLPLSWAISLSESPQNVPNVPIWDIWETRTICHISDIHAAIEQYPRQVPICPESGYAISRLTMIKELTKGCDFTVFTGDLMHGTDYDLLNSEQLPTDIASIFLPTWGVDVWSVGNHDYPTVVKQMNSTTPTLVSGNVNRLPDLDFETTEVFINDQFCIFSVIDVVLLDESLDVDNEFSFIKPLEYLKDTVTSKWDVCHDKLRILISHQGWKLDDAMLIDFNEFWQAQMDTDTHPFHLLLGAHTHNLTENYPVFHRGVWVSHVGAHGHNMGRIEIRKANLGHFSLSKASISTTLYDIWDLGEAEGGWGPTQVEVVLDYVDETPPFYDPPQMSQKLSQMSQMSQKDLLEDPKSLLLGRIHSKNSHFPLFTPSEFAQLCAEDTQLLSQYRQKMESVVQMAVSTTVIESRDVPNLAGDVRKCRCGQCAVGSWIAASMLLTAYAVKGGTSLDGLSALGEGGFVCSDEFLDSVDSGGGGAEDEGMGMGMGMSPRRHRRASASPLVGAEGNAIGMSLYDIFDFHLSSPSITPPPPPSETLKGVSLKGPIGDEETTHSHSHQHPPHIVISIISSGTMRTIFPSCLSFPQFKLGGCEDRITKYDVDRMLPFQNDIAVGVSTVNGVCNALGKLKDKMKNGCTPAMIQSAGMKYFFKDHPNNGYNARDEDQPAPVLASDAFAVNPNTRLINNSFFDLVENDEIGIVFTDNHHQRYWGGCERLDGGDGGWKYNNYYWLGEVSEVGVAENMSQMSQKALKNGVLSPESVIIIISDSFLLNGGDKIIDVPNCTSSINVSDAVSIFGQQILEWVK